MKKTTKSAFIFLLSISTLLIGFGAVSTTSAQEISTENVLLQKLDALVEQLANLAGVSKVQNASSIDGPEPINLQATSMSVDNPRCLDDYTTLPHSTVFNPNADWSTASFEMYYVAPNTFNNLVDINGDGLLDYIYSIARDMRYANGEYYIPINASYNRKLVTA